MPVTLICARCGQDFSVAPSQAGRQYCSMTCFRAQQTQNTAWTTHACLRCGTDFRVRGKDDEAGRRPYCSRSCHLAATARQTCACAQCGTEFVPKNPTNPAGSLQGRFCSKTCSGIAQRTRLARTCRNCGNTFEIKASRVKSGRGSYCDRACQYEAEGSVQEPCQSCGKEFHVPRSVQERGWGTYCSQACTARRVARACQVCGSQFSVKQSVADEGRGLYCSNDCRHLGKRDQVDKTCEACGTAFSVPQSIKNRRTCSRTCWWKIMGTDPGRAAILARARHDMLTNRAPTRPERILYALLDTLTAEVDGLRWERQLRLLDRWTVDAAIPALQLVLQADGDYWHGFHPKYHTDPRVRHHMANDAFQDRKLTAAGWTVHRFWERDLIHNLPSCTQRLRAAITERTAPPAARR